MNWFTRWIYSLLAAVIGGAANTGAAMFVAPETFNVNDLPKLGKLLLAGAVISLILFLKQSPLPPVPPEKNPPGGAVAGLLALLAAYFVSFVAGMVMFALLAGCSTPGSNSGTGGSTNQLAFTPEQASQAAELVGRIGSRFAVVLSKRPELRADFDLAASGIDALLLQGTLNSQSVRETLAQIDVDASDELWLLIDSLLDVYQVFLDPLVSNQVNRNAYVRPVLEGLRNGLRSAPTRTSVAPK